MRRTCRPRHAVHNITLLLLADSTRKSEKGTTSLLIRIVSWALLMPDAFQESWVSGMLNSQRHSHHLENVKPTQPHLQCCHEGLFTATSCLLT